METTSALLNQFNENIPGRKMMNSANSILLINPFNKHGMWVFNDNRTGLIEEPFIAGAELFIEFLLQKLGFLESAKTGFNALFATLPFPEHDARIDFIEFKDMGSVYTTNLQGFKNRAGENKLWLCPALNLYFKNSPQNLFVKFKENK